MGAIESPTDSSSRPHAFVFCVVKATAFCAAAGYISLWFGEMSDSLITKLAPTYYRATYPNSQRHSTDTFDAPRKLGHGDLLMSIAVFVVIAEALLVGTYMSLVGCSLLGLIRLSAVISIGAAFGAAVGGLFGFFISMGIPDQIKVWYTSGGEPWFVPADMGIVAGAKLGFVVCFTLGGLIHIWSARVRPHPVPNC